MVKRTLYFGNPAYLKTKTEQLVIEKADDGEVISVPIEDVGLIILDHAQITITSGLMARLLEKNVALISCDNTHHPTGLILILVGHTLQSRQFAAQLDASLPMKKQMWQQTITAKIYNQASLLKQLNKENKFLLNLAKDVKSGDSENHEAKAASYYWKNLFPPFVGSFRRDRYGMPPNNLLNYGYAILRAVVARSLVGSGLLPTLGIFHRNQYNAYCLADDIMEPYRPFVDKLVCKMLDPLEPAFDLTPEIKRQLLTIPAMDVSINGDKSPLMTGVQRTTASLAKCFEGKAKNIVYGELE
jgi:CRISPR-associated protein Cas1